MAGDLQGKVSVVTGGARNIGKAIAGRFAVTAETILDGSLETLRMTLDIKLRSCFLAFKYALAPCCLWGPKTELSGRPGIERRWRHGSRLTLRNKG